LLLPGRVLYTLSPRGVGQRENLSGSLAKVGRRDIIERSVDNFRKADRNLGERLAKAIVAGHCCRADLSGRQEPATVGPATYPLFDVD
jgi:hypothetical protein